MLRVEIVAHNGKDLRCGALVEKWPRLLKTMEPYLHHFLNIVQAAHVSFLDEGTFDTLAMPTQRGNRRQAGVDFNKLRMRQVAAAVIALAPQPTGFTVSDLARKVSDRNVKSTTPGVRLTICQRSVAKVWWNVSANRAVTVPRLPASES